MVKRAVTIPLNAVRVSATSVGGVMRLIQLRSLDDIFLDPRLAIFSENYLT
jgi:hypothetical protein